MQKLYSAAEIIRILNISAQKLYYWRETSKISYKKIGTRTYLYEMPNLINQMNDRKNAIYSRVSTNSQQEDLFRQTRVIREYMLQIGVIPDEVYEDIGSGMNFDRLKFQELLNLVLDNQIDTIYISFKDRLCRFGYELFDNICKAHGSKIKILNASDERDYQTELTQDLIAIIHHFSMKYYGGRKKQMKSIQKEISQYKEEKKITKDNNNTILN